jgi:hypothetical protein
MQHHNRDRIFDVCHISVKVEPNRLFGTLD